MQKSLAACIALGLSLSSFAASKLTPVPVYTDVKSATEAVADFPLVGEYISKDGKAAIQVNMLPESTLLVAQYAAGLPGDGWDGSAIISSLKSPEELKAVLIGFQKIERHSPSLGKPAPQDAILVFPDDFTNVKNGIMMAGGQTTRDLGSFHMHIEFMLPFKPDRYLTSQDRGNSGIYIFNNYEIQVIDSFALDLASENNAIETQSLNTQWCGALYRTKTPDVHMVFPPLQWQTYDIDFTAPEFDGNKKVKPARISVWHNGILIHDDVELQKGTGNGAKKPQLAQGTVFFQNHGNPVMFRNIWATERK